MVFDKSSYLVIVLLEIKMHSFISSQLYCLEYLNAHGGGVITVIAEATTNYMAPSAV